MKVFPRLTLSSKFEIVEVGGEVTAVSVGGEGSTYNGVIMLKNEATRFMFERLQEGTTLPELIKACMDEYTDSNIDEIGPEVINFLNTMGERNLLLADPEHGLKVED